MHCTMISAEFEFGGSYLSGNGSAWTMTIKEVKTGRSALASSQPANRLQAGSIDLHDM